MSRHHGRHRSHEMQDLTEREILALIEYLDPDRDQEQVPSWVVTAATLLVLFLIYAGILWLGQWLFRA